MRDCKINKKTKFIEKKFIHIMTNILHPKRDLFKCQFVGRKIQVMTFVGTKEEKNEDNRKVEPKTFYMLHICHLLPIKRNGLVLTIFTYKSYSLK